MRLCDEGVSIDEISDVEQRKPAHQPDPKDQVAKGYQMEDRKDHDWSASQVYDSATSVNCQAHSLSLFLIKGILLTKISGNCAIWAAKRYPRILPLTIAMTSSCKKELNRNVTNMADVLEKPREEMEDA